MDVFQFKASGSACDFPTWYRKCTGSMNYSRHVRISICFHIYRMRCIGTCGRRHFNLLRLARNTASIRLGPGCLSVSVLNQGWKAMGPRFTLGCTRPIIFHAAGHVTLRHPSPHFIRCSFFHFLAALSLRDGQAWHRHTGSFHPCGTTWHQEHNMKFK